MGIVSAVLQHERFQGQLLRLQTSWLSAMTDLFGIGSITLEPAAIDFEDTKRSGNRHDSDPELFNSVRTAQESPHVETQKAGTHSDGDNIAFSSAQPWPKIKALYVCIDSQSDRARCMSEQLEFMKHQVHAAGGLLDFTPFPAVTFQTCSTIVGCKQERPECFPDGRVSQIYHPRVSKSKRKTAMRGVIGNWCAHLKLLQGLVPGGATRRGHYDYYLMVEDDVILMPSFTDKLLKLLTRLPTHWTLVALDTFNNPGVTLPQVDVVSTVDAGLYSISMSNGTYYGAHAWLVPELRIPDLLRHFDHNPTMPLDWVPKADRALHLGFLSYQSGAVAQKSRLKDTAAGRTHMKQLGTTCRKQKGSDIENGGRKLQNAIEDPGTNGRPREMILLGLYDTGTNYLLRLVRENLEQPNKIELCKNYTGWAYCGRVWKHTHPNRLEEALSHVRRCNEHGCENLPAIHQAVGVVLVRHPFSLIRSLQTNSYDLDCGDSSNSGSQWMTRGCEYVEPLGRELELQFGMPRVHRPICPNAESDKPCADNVVHLWNSYMAGLKKIRKLFYRMLVLRYEDVLLHPDVMVRNIARTVGMQMHGDVRINSEPAKRKSGGLEDALRKLRSPNYNSSYSKGEQNTLCRLLNRSLLFEFGYSGCQEQDPGFWNRIYVQR